MFLRILVVFLNFISILAANSFADPSDLLCDALLKKYMKPSRVIQLHYEPGSEVEYSFYRSQFDSVYLPRVDLVLDEFSDLKKIARHLAVHGNQKEILSHLKQSLENGSERISFNELLPEYPRKILGKRSLVYKANCFNASLIFHNPSMKLFWVSPGKFPEYLKREYKMLSSGEDLRFGDIITIGTSGDYRHAMVYMGDDIVFHKATLTLDSPYVLERFVDAAKIYYQQGLRVDVEFFRSKNFGKQKSRFHHVQDFQ